MFDTQVVKFQMSGPEDVSGLAEAVAEGRIQAADIQAVIAKTEGNGRVNDYSRPYALHSFEDYMMEKLGLSRADYLELERLITAGVHAREVQDTGMPLEDAYATLGVSPDTPEAEIKRHYRRLMSRHHPDKLASQGLPEEMMRAATERTQQIKAAWDAIRRSRGERLSAG